jgi:KDO2-lipid IV(A) lauroyltransferase
LHGAETYAKMFDMPLIYLDLQRIKRGRYQIEISIIEEHPTETGPGEITAKYMKRLEETIRNKPEDWLWSHKRWKHKRERQNVH